MVCKYDEMEQEKESVEVVCPNLWGNLVVARSCLSYVDQHIFRWVGHSERKKK